MATLVQATPVQQPMDADRAGSGFLCSTSGEVYTDREQLKAHFQSDFHRYNLKRKVAGLPPVTREWFEARKAQLSSAQAAGAVGSIPAGATQVWFDPLTRKTFRTEQTYQAHVRSNKYQELVRKSGQPAPAAVISFRKPAEVEQQEASASSTNKAAPTAAQQAQVGFKVVPPSGGLPSKKDAKDEAASGDEEEEEDGWETASDDEVEAAAEGVSRISLGVRGGVREEGEEGEDGEEEAWEEWDLCRSLFDNHISKDFEANLEYMWRKYGFYLPDAQYLADPEGLLKYLGSKIRYGRVPLYTRGDDSNAKQFRSLHAVQRHMVDSGRCKIVYEDNEEEYSDFYDYSLGEENDEDGDEQGAGSSEGKELVAAGGRASAGPAAAVVTYAHELMVPGKDGAGSKVLGSREFARYYRQRHRPVDERQIVVVNQMHAKYRALGIALRDEAVALEVKKAKTKSKMDLKWEGKRYNGLFLRSNKILQRPKLGSAGI